MARLRVSPIPDIHEDAPCATEFISDGDNAMVRDSAGDVMVKLERILDRKQVAMSHFPLWTC